MHEQGSPVEQTEGVEAFERTTSVPLLRERAVERILGKVDVNAEIVWSVAHHPCEGGI